MLTIYLPDNCESERKYIVSTVFKEFLGIQFRLVFESRTDIVISLGGRSIIINDTFFMIANSNWLQATTLPQQPLVHAKLPNELQSQEISSSTLPVLFGEAFQSENYFKLSAQENYCGIDILGSCFFLLSRYEELLIEARDEHGRYMSESSIAEKEGFLQRPLVDEYVEVLWSMLRSLWPTLQRKENHYQLILSHDVDSPFAVAGRSAAVMTISIAYFLFRQRNVAKAKERIRSSWNVFKSGITKDPYNTFPYIMSLSEKYGVQSTFNFITKRRVGRRDGNYSFSSPEIAGLIKSIKSRGHYVGLHPGYDTFQNTEMVHSEFDILRKHCEQLGVEQDVWGGRQHFLRWENPVTWRAWDLAGIDYDSSVGFHDAIGFRCGTCRDYPTYDLIHRKPLNLIERPLIVMECALTWYRKKSWESCCEEIVQLSSICRRLKGNFTLLWHNDQLATEEERYWYKTIIGAAA